MLLHPLSQMRLANTRLITCRLVQTVLLDFTTEVIAGFHCIADSKCFGKEISRLKTAFPHPLNRCHYSVY